MSPRKPSLCIQAWVLKDDIQAPSLNLYRMTDKMGRIKKDRWTGGSKGRKNKWIRQHNTLKIGALRPPLNPTLPFHYSHLHPDPYLPPPLLPQLVLSRKINDLQVQAQRGARVNLAKSQRDVSNCILQRSCSPFSQSLPVTSALCAESSPIDPASNERVLGSKLLTSQHAGVRRLPRRAQITKRLITEGRVKGPRDRRAGWLRKRDETGWDDKEETGKWALSSVWTTNCLLMQGEVPPPHLRMCESFFGALKIQTLYPSLPSCFSLVKPRPNHKLPCVISQQCFWAPGLMAQCSLFDMYCLAGRSALSFSSNLIPKLLKQESFSFSLCVCA